MWKAFSLYGKYVLLPVLACLFLLPCLLFWRSGLAHYKSTGS